MVSDLNILVWKLSKSAAQNSFFADFALQNMVETTLPDGLETSGFSKKLCFWVFLVHPPMASVLLSASVERCFVSRMRDFLCNFCEICKKRTYIIQTLVVREYHKMDWNNNPIIFVCHIMYRTNIRIYSDEIDLKTNI